MNYRHAFHAGNFADLVKHAALLRMLGTLQAAPGAVQVIDTHAGRGLYDLGGAEAERSGEARDGVLRLMEAREPPAGLDDLQRAVSRLNGGGEARLYPGSPMLVAGRLRAGDSYLGCELRPQEHSALGEALAPWPAARTVCADGYVEAPRRLDPAARTLGLIDPPFEKSDDYDRCVGALTGIARKAPDAVVAVWLPLKDLETFDAFLRAAEDACPRPLLIAEARMRPLNDPMRMNGCALVIANPTEGLAAELSGVCEWVVANLGQGGEARVWTA